MRLLSRRAALARDGASRDASRSDKPVVSVDGVEGDDGGNMVCAACLLWQA